MLIISREKRFQQKNSHLKQTIFVIILTNFSTYYLHSWDIDSCKLSFSWCIFIKEYTPPETKLGVGNSLYAVSLSEIVKEIWKEEENSISLLKEDQMNIWQVQNGLLQNKIDQAQEM